MVKGMMVMTMTMMLMMMMTVMVMMMMMREGLVPCRVEFSGGGAA